MTLYYSGIVIVIVTIIVICYCYIRDINDLKYMKNNNVLQLVSNSDWKVQILNVLRIKRFVCDKQIQRLIEIIDYALAKKGMKDMNVVRFYFFFFFLFFRIGIKKRLFNDNSGSIPDDTEVRKEVLRILWEDEKKKFDFVVAKLHL